MAETDVDYGWLDSAADFFGVTGAGFGVLYASGGVKGDFYGKYEISYNIGLKADVKLPPVFSGSVEYRPTSWDGGSLRVTGGAGLFKQEFTYRHTTNSQGMVTEDYGFKVKSPGGSISIFGGVFTDEDTALGSVLSFSYDTRNWKKFSKFVDMYAEYVGAPLAAIEKGIGLGAEVPPGGLQWSLNFSFTLRADILSRDLTPQVGESWSDRRDRALGTPGEPGYLGDKYVSSEIVNQYVNSYASGDLQKAAKVLVSGYNGVAITGDKNFYPDAILRKQAGYEGGTGSGSTLISKSSGTSSTKKQESYADKYSGSGGGGGDSGKAGSAVSSKSTSSSKNEYGYEKTTTTTTYKSGVSQTTTKQTVSTPAGPKEVTKTTTKAAPQPKDDPKKTGPQPILLDLDGNGVKITEYQNSTQFMTGKDGLQHRSSWAGAGDGVLFYDPDGRNAITEHRQYVFTEWNPTAAGDLEALRSIWDTNGDGKLSAADAEFAKFKVMVTNADGSTTVMTLAALGITEINLTANTVNIELPDGSVITGQTTFTRSNGTTGTVANTTLTGDGAGSWRDWDRRLAA